MARLFGTDGIRGVANIAPMTPETALAVGRALVNYCRQSSETRPMIIVGRDTRLSGSMLQAAVAAGICSAGGDVVEVGVLPTAGVAFAVERTGASAGVVISASHNPFEDNGIKIFAAGGVKLTDEQEAWIETLILNGSGEVGPRGAGIGSCREIPGLVDEYVSFCGRTFPGTDLGGTSLVLDCANGATSQVAPRVFSALTPNLTVVNNTPDGVNINTECGSEHTDGLCAKVRELGADCGLAFDGDGDRVIAVDENGTRLTGDQLIAICARMYKDREWLDNGVVVTTVMSNMGLAQALDELGVKHAKTQVGDRPVAEAMRQLGAVIGGEESGHIIVRRYHTTGDGIIAGLQLLAAVKYYGLSVSELARTMTVFPQKIVNVTVATKPPLEEISGLSAAVGEAEAALGDKGRILIRYSGTQSMCRVMVEGQDANEIAGIAGRLASIIKEGVGA